MRTGAGWPALAGAVAIAVLTNAVSVKWARGENRFSGWFFLMVALAPLVFMSFGLVASKLGLAMGSAIVDSLLTACTIAVGLALLQEWRAVSALQCLGMALALAGVFLMLFFPKPPA
jgi:multidrug transporter EmrE-like cation transporter